MTEHPGATRPDAYAREIERQWSRLLDRPVVLSPKDWSLISDWHARSIPLSVILDAMQHLNENPRGRSAPRSLAYLVPAVEETWQVVLDGRRAAPAAARRPEAPDPVQCWRRCLAGLERSSALHGLLAGLLAQFEAGRDGEALDDALDARIAGDAPRDLLARVRGEVEGELAPFEDRLDPGTRERTLNAAVALRLRRLLGLPRLRRGQGAGRPEAPRA